MGQPGPGVVLLPASVALGAASPRDCTFQLVVLHPPVACPGLVGVKDFATLVANLDLFSLLLFLPAEIRWGRSDLTEDLADAPMKQLKLKLLRLPPDCSLLHRPAEIIPPLLIFSSPIKGAVVEGDCAVQQVCTPAHIFEHQLCP